MGELKTIFPDFDQELIDHLAAVGQVIDIPEGEVLMRTGQYFKQSLLLLGGRVKVYREGEDGEEFFLYYLEPGNACALSMVCAARSEPSEVKAIAVTPVRALAIPLQYMDGLMR